MIRSKGDLVLQGTRKRMMGCALAGVLSLFSGAALGASLKQVTLPRPGPHIVDAATSGAAAKVEYDTASLTPAASAIPKDDPALPFSADPSVSKSDLNAVKEAIDLTRRGKTQEAAGLQHRIEDPLARKLTEWVILRSDDNTADSSRYRSFIAANPSWPSLIMFRKRAEAMLWQERADLATVRSFTRDRPISGKGRFAPGRALLARGDRTRAQAAIPHASRTEPLARKADEQA